MDPIIMASINMGLAVFLQCLKDKKLKAQIRDIAFKVYTSILVAFPEFAAPAEPNPNIAPGPFAFPFAAKSAKTKGKKK